MSQKYEQIGMYKTASLLRHTGKSWHQWIQVLNDAGAIYWDHRTTVAYLRKKYKISAWWQQVVTQGYQIATGKRIEGQNLKGEYTLTVTKTFPADKISTWKIIASEAGLSTWLGQTHGFILKPKVQFETDDGVFGEIRTMKSGERIRLTWQESDWEKSTVVQIWVIARKGPKCLLVFTHEKIPNTRMKAQLRDRWKNVMNDLVSLAPVDSAGSIVHSRGIPSSARSQISSLSKVAKNSNRKKKDSTTVKKAIGKKKKQINK